MSEEIAIGPGTTLRVVGRTDDLLELEATYAGGGSPPPPHFHPAQDERFEVLAGTMQVRMDGAEREITAGDVIEIPRGTVHAMWNREDQPAVVNWRTEPAGRTLDWFREVAAVLRGEGRPNPEDLLTDYADVYRLADQ